MKKLFPCVLFFLIISASLNAQYKIYKTKYNFRDYSYELGDPYNPGVAGVCSFLVPGLGQMISGEAGRGVAFLGAEVGFGIVYFTGVAKAVNTMDVDYYGNTTASGGGAIIVGALGMLVVNVWSIVDAVRVAKVNDMAWRDKKRTSFQIDPYFGNKQFAATGLSFKVQF
jgi:hypothetical protein